MLSAWRARAVAEPSAVGLAAALGIGVLIGLDRERRKGEGADRAAAGVRTFALAALLGGAAMVTGGAALTGIAAVAVGLFALVGYTRAHGDDPGMTTEVALVLTVILGAFAQIDTPYAAGLGVVVAMLLTERQRMHRFVQRVMSEQELEDLLLLAAAAAVVLPLVPDRGMGPYGAVNPAVVWRLVVLVMAIGGAGYVSLRLLGPRLGLPVAGLAGGFVSSVATIGSMAGVSRRNPGLRQAAVAGAILSSVATIVQMAVVLAATSTAVLREVAPALGASGTVAVIAGSMAGRRVGSVPTGETITQGRAFDLRQALLLAATVAGLMVVAAALNDTLGSSGLFVGTAVAGFADAHAAAISAATLVAQGKVSAAEAAPAILAGLTANTVTKAIVAFASGRRTFGWLIGIGLAAMMVALWAGAAISWSV